MSGFDGLRCRLTTIGTIVASAPGIAPHLRSRLEARLARIRGPIEAAATPGRHRRRSLWRARHRIVAVIDLLPRLAASRRIGSTEEGLITDLLRAAKRDVDLLLLDDRVAPHR
jgi:hypothetical protein